MSLDNNHKTFNKRTHDYIYLQLKGYVSEGFAHIIFEFTSESMEYDLY